MPWRPDKLGGDAGRRPFASPPQWPRPSVSENSTCPPHLLSFLNLCLPHSFLAHFGSSQQPAVPFSCPNRRRSDHHRHCRIGRAASRERTTIATFARRGDGRRAAVGPAPVSSIGAPAASSRLSRGRVEKWWPECRTSAVVAATVFPLSGVIIPHSRGPTPDQRP
jgi:hypothetical protein